MFTQAHGIVKFIVGLVLLTIFNMIMGSQFGPVYSPVAFVSGFVYGILAGSYWLVPLMIK
jgi:hypothetical protein